MFAYSFGFLRARREPDYGCHAAAGAVARLPGSIERSGCDCHPGGDSQSALRGTHPLSQGTASQVGFSGFSPDFQWDFFIWFSVGFLQVFNVFSSGFQRVFTKFSVWFFPGDQWGFRYHQVFREFYPGFQWVFTSFRWSFTSFQWVFTRFSLSFCKIFSLFSPDFLWVFTRFSMGFDQSFCEFTPMRARISRMYVWDKVFECFCWLVFRRQSQICDEERHLRSLQVETMKRVWKEVSRSLLCCCCIRNWVFPFLTFVGFEWLYLSDWKLVVFAIVFLFNYANKVIHFSARNSLLISNPTLFLLTSH